MMKVVNLRLVVPDDREVWIRGEGRNLSHFERQPVTAELVADLVYQDDDGDLASLVLGVVPLIEGRAGHIACVPVMAKAIVAENMGGDAIRALLERGA